MGQESDEIRREIEQTRSRMGDTVEAIGYKADVPSRMRDAVSDRVETVKGTIGDALSGVKSAVGGVRDNVSDATGNAAGNAAGTASDIAGKAQRRVAMAAENPLGVSIGALALGFLGGLFIPMSEGERARIQPVTSGLGDRAQTVIDEAVEAGKSVITETVQAAMSSAKEHGKTVVQHASGATGASAEPEIGSFASESV